MNVMKTVRSKRTLGAVTPEDFVKLEQLRRMQAIALWLLVAMAVVFAVSFGLQSRFVWAGYVRAASEGGMVGAIADWFAVTALFRRPLGLPIPHTNLIAGKKDEIGEGLGSFIEENFLADEVVHERLSTISGARISGTWLQDPVNAKKVTGFAAQAGIAGLTVLSDADVQDLLESLIREHVIDPPWSSTIGRVTEQLLEAGHHHALIDIVADHAEQWLVTHPESFNALVSSRMPSWVPSIANRFIDDRAHKEVVKFVRAVRDNEQHPFREAANRFLHDLTHDLQSKPQLQEQVEQFKEEIFDSPRIRTIVESTWNSARASLTAMLEDEHSELRARMTRAVTDFGRRLLDDPTLQYKIDVWVMTAVEHLVHTYRHDLAQVVTETVYRWDASEAAEKIELQVGKDLQFIRINGTVVGSIAGVTIYTIATLIHTLVG